jgi:hypothetical protein
MAAGVFGSGRTWVAGQTACPLGQQSKPYALLGLDHLRRAGTDRTTSLDG